MQKTLSPSSLQWARASRLREIPSRWRMGDRQWIDPADFAVDIRRDGSGEFFELLCRRICANRSTFP
jgi:hypothetical protein